MLVLTRRIGESVVVPDGELTISILEIRGNKVRLGFSAERQVQIHRKEVWERISPPVTTTGESFDEETGIDS